MPRSSYSSSRGDGDDASGSGSGRKRYSAVVEKGENAWKREWSSFMSGVNLKRLRDGTSGVSLKASADLERQIVDSSDATASPSSSTRGRQRSASAAAAAATAPVNDDGIPIGAGAVSAAAFSYLFSSPAERRAERDARERAEREKRQAERRAQMAKKDPLSVMSKHQRALYDASQRGLQMNGMNRKERRDFLRLTVTEAQKKAEMQSREFKLHDLMDEKLAWYQQGPHPVDLIAEKLVRRKAEKKAKQLGLKYNYLAPHPSWLAKRAQRRREGLLVGLGKRLIFHDEDYDDVPGGAMTVTDPLHQRTVPLEDMRLLLMPTAADQAQRKGDHEAANGAATPTDDDDEMDADAVVDAAMQGGESSSDEEEEAQQEHSRDDQPAHASLRHDGAAEREVVPSAHHRENADESNSHSGALPPPRVPDVGVLQDPAHLTTSFVRRVVRDRATAVAIQQMNRTTTFLSSGLVKGPSLQPEDAALANGLPLTPMAIVQRVSGAAAARAAPKRPTRATAAPSFSPYEPSPSVERREGEEEVSRKTVKASKRPSQDEADEKPSPKRARTDTPAEPTKKLKKLKTKKAGAALADAPLHDTETVKKKKKKAAAVVE